VSEQRPTGRPSKLNDGLHEAIVKILRTGCTVETAAENAGISKRTLQSWLQKGEDAETRSDAGHKLTAADQRYMALAQDVRRARSEAEVRALATIQRAAADGTWQAAAWYLERSFPERYASKRQPKSVGRPVGAVSAPDRASAPPRLKVVG
jgi:transposase